MLNRNSAEIRNEDVNNVFCEDSIKLFHSDSFICFGMDTSKIMIKKMDDEASDYKPESGILLFDVDIYKNPVLGSITLTGKQKTVFKPPRNLICPYLTLINNQELEELADVEQSDIKLSLFGYSIITRQYYFKKKIDKISRCFFDVPLIILNYTGNGSDG